MRRTLKTRLTRLEKHSAAPKVEVLWVDVDSGQTHETVIKTKYGDSVPSDVDLVAVSWMRQQDRATFEFLVGSNHAVFSRYRSSGFGSRNNI